MGGLLLVVYSLFREGGSIGWLCFKCNQDLCQLGTYFDANSASSKTHPHQVDKLILSLIYIFMHASYINNALCLLRDKFA